MIQQRIQSVTAVIQQRIQSVTAEDTAEDTECDSRGYSSDTAEGTAVIQQRVQSVTAEGTAV